MAGQPGSAFSQEAMERLGEKWRAFEETLTPEEREPSRRRWMPCP